MAQLTCLFFPDLAPWEKESFQPVLRSLTEYYEIEARDITEADRGLLRGKGSDAHYWVVSSHWHEALRFLSPPFNFQGRVFVSVLKLHSPHAALPTLFLRKLLPSIPACVRWIVHSPLNYRFFREIQNLSDAQLAYLPLTRDWSVEKRTSHTTEQVTVGTFGPFATETNLNFLMNVAHYCVQKNPSLLFRFLGTGELYKHFSDMANDLGLASHVTLVETNDAQDISELDIFLYTPLRNDHVLPILYAADERIPVLASELPGLSDLIRDGHSGFLTPVHQTKPLAELILRLAADSELRRALGEKLASVLSQKFPLSKVADQYAALFFGRTIPQTESGALL